MAPALSNPRHPLPPPKIRAAPRKMKHMYKTNSKNPLGQSHKAPPRRRRGDGFAKDVGGRRGEPRRGGTTSAGTGNTRHIRRGGGTHVASGRRTCGVSHMVEAWPAHPQVELDAGHQSQRSKIAQKPSKARPKPSAWADLASAVTRSRPNHPTCFASPRYPPNAPASSPAPDPPAS
jgi:hypothetical protein